MKFWTIDVIFPEYLAINRKWYDVLKSIALYLRVTHND